MYFVVRKALFYLSKYIYLDDYIYSLLLNETKIYLDKINMLDVNIIVFL